MSRQEAESETRNAWFREKTKVAIGGVTKFIHDKFPYLTPEHISAAGVVGIVIGAAIAEKQNSQNQSSFRDKIPTVLLLGASSLLDALDGSLARLKAQEDSLSINPNGQLVDVIADRMQESFMAISRAVSANKREDTLGEFIAYVSSTSNVTPSLMRAISELRGNPVPEGGKNAISFLGTRVGRSFTGIFSTVFPEVKGVPTQKIFDALNITANALSTYERAQISLKHAPIIQSLDFETKEKARTRTKVLTAVAGATLITAYATYKTLRR